MGSVIRRLSQNGTVSTFLRWATLCTTLVAPSLAAEELVRLFVDLDRDGKREVVKMERFQGPEPHRSDVRVSVGDSEYRTDYFSLHGDRPDLRAVTLDEESGLWALVLTTGESYWCVGHLLTYVDGRLRRIFKHETIPLCDLQFYRNRRFIAIRWKGFWKKEVIHRVTDDGLGTQREPVRPYAVGEAGYAATALQLEGASCGSHAVTPGAYVLVKEFDAVKKRYLVQDAGSACGWIPESEIQSDSRLIKGLPWAG
jgi:hypothetical protein